MDSKRTRVKPYSIHPYFIEIKKQFNTSSVRSNRNNIFMPLKSAQMKIRPRSGSKHSTLGSNKKELASLESRKRKLGSKKEAMRTVKVRKELEINPWFIKDEDPPEL